jgi:thiosulfate/3-mercaptopyruvate sulfurtransferase
VNSRDNALVSPEWLEAHLDDPAVQVIEIAGLGQEQMQAFDSGHVPGALGWEWKSMLWDSHARDFPLPQEFARRLGDAGIGNDTTVVVYGEPVQFGVYAWWTFTYCGHRDVRVLDGARQRWQAEGRPWSAEPARPRARTGYTPVARNDQVRIDRNRVLGALGRADTVLLDGRSGEEYRGERVGAPGGPDIGALRYGRIPGAKHLLFEDLLQPDKSFKSAEAIETAARTRGATRDKNIITYCRMSHRATVLYFALTELAGYDNVRVYDGSWTEWGNLVGVPVER